MLINVFIFSINLAYSSLKFELTNASDQIMNLFYEDLNASKKRTFKFSVDGERKGFKAIYNENTKGKASELIDANSARNFYLLNCQNPNKLTCQKPPTYLWGGKGKIINREKRIINLLQNEDDVEQKAKHPGIDCSGLVNLSFLKAGLRVTNTMDPIDTPFEVSAKEFMRPLSCFDVVKIEKNEKLQVGDLVAWDKHIFIIDKNSQDPFGIKDIKSPEKCDMRLLDPQKAKLVLINSKGANDPEENLTLDLVQNSPSLKKLVSDTIPLKTGIGPGLVKMSFAEMALSSPYEMLELMQSACLAKFKIFIPTKRTKVVRHKLLQKNYSKEDLMNCQLNEKEHVTITAHY